MADRKTEPIIDQAKADLEKWAMWSKTYEAMCKTEPQTCDTCKWGEWYRKGYDITMMSDECGGCCSWNSKWIPKDEPQTDCAWK